MVVKYDVRLALESISVWYHGNKGMNKQARLTDLGKRPSLIRERHGCHRAHQTGASGNHTAWHYRSTTSGYKFESDKNASKTGNRPQPDRAVPPEPNKQGQGRDGEKPPSSQARKTRARGDEATRQGRTDTTYLNNRRDEPQCRTNEPTEPE